MSPEKGVMPSFCWFDGSSADGVDLRFENENRHTHFSELIGMAYFGGCGALCPLNGAGSAASRAHLLTHRRNVVHRVTSISNYVHSVYDTYM